MAFGFPALIGAGMQASGGIADFMESRRTADIAKTQGKLRKRQSEKRQRGMVGRQIASSGAAGVELSGTTLDKINQTNYEFELDQAIIAESSKLEQDAIKRQGGQDLFGGLAAAGLSLYEGYTPPAKLTKAKQAITTKAMPQFGMPWAPMGAIK
jgi:hypothetical protein